MIPKLQNLHIHIYHLLPESMTILTRSECIRLVCDLSTRRLNGPKAFNISYCHVRIPGKHYLAILKMAMSLLCRSIDVASVLLTTEALPMFN